MSETGSGAAFVLASLIAAVPGVVRVYPATNVVARVGAAIGAAVAGEAPADGDIMVGSDRIRIRVGVDSDSAAASVCRDVYAVVRRWAEQAGRSRTVIEVTVVGIEEATGSARSSG